MPIELSRKVTIRLSPEVYGRLAAVASQTQRTVSDVVRCAVEDLPVRPRRQDRHLGELIRQLARIGNNLNQQSRVLHLLKHRGDLPDGEALLATLKRVQETLQTVSRQVATLPESRDARPLRVPQHPSARTPP